MADLLGGATLSAQNQEEKQASNGESSNTAFKLADRSAPGDPNVFGFGCGCAACSLTLSLDEPSTEATTP